MWAGRLLHRLSALMSSSATKGAGGSACLRPHPSQCPDDRCRGECRRALAAGACCACAAFSGIVSVKTLPSPGVLATAMSPPMSRARRLQSASPRPAPPWLRFVELSACSNSWNSRGSLSAGMPGPVSATLNANCSGGSSPVIALTRSTTWPWSRNLMALESRWPASGRSCVHPHAACREGPGISAVKPSAFDSALAAASLAGVREQGGKTEIDGFEVQLFDSSFTMSGLQPASPAGAATRAQ